MHNPVYNLWKRGTVGNLGPIEGYIVTIGKYSAHLKEHTENPVQREVELIGASAASPVLARSMLTLFVCLFICHQPTGRIAHAQKLAKHM